MMKLFNGHKNLINKIANQVSEEQQHASQQITRVRKDIENHKKQMNERRKNFSLIRNK